MNKLSKKNFDLLVTGILGILVVCNIIFKFYYPNEMIGYFIDVIFFIVFGVGISDLIKKLVIKNNVL